MMIDQEQAAARNQPVTTRVVLVDDHTLLRQTLRNALQEEPYLEVVGEAGDPDEAFAVFQATRADLILLDIELPGEDGISLAERIIRAGFGVRIAFLTMHDDDASIRRALALGVAGFILKTAPIDELLRAIRSIADDASYSYLSPQIAKKVMELASGRSGISDHLTNREIEVLRLLAQGHRANDIAGTLFVSNKTVKNHLTRVYSKLGVETASQAVSEAFRRGLVTISEA